MERPMSIEFVDETTPSVHHDARVAGPLPRSRRETPPRQRRQRYADSGIPVVDDRMRLPSFVETCPHVRDKIIPLNGGRFNVDHYLRVLRAKAELDVSVAMALTVRAG